MTKSATASNCGSMSWPSGHRSPASISDVQAITPHPIPAARHSSSTSMAISLNQSVAQRSTRDTSPVHWILVVHRFASIVQHRIIASAVGLTPRSPPCMSPGIARISKRTRNLQWPVNHTPPPAHVQAHGQKQSGQADRLRSEACPDAGRVREGHLATTRSRADLDPHRRRHSPLRVHQPSGLRLGRTVGMWRRVRSSTA